MSNRHDREWAIQRMQEQATFIKYILGYTKTNPAYVGIIIKGRGHKNVSSARSREKVTLAFERGPDNSFKLWNPEEVRFRFKKPITRRRAEQIVGIGLYFSADPAEAPVRSQRVNGYHGAPLPPVTLPDDEVAIAVGQLMLSF